MAKFEVKYSDMKPLDERDSIMLGDCAGRCFMCGNETRYIEINYEAFFCSDECVAEMDRMAESIIMNGYKRRQEDDQD